MSDFTFDKNCNQKGLLQEHLAQLIDGLMMSVSFNPGLVGYKYLQEALLINYKCGEVKLSKRLYPYLAEKYGVSWESIEHAIRTLIKDCFCYGDLRRLNDIFHCKIIDDVYVPTNGEFISKVTRCLRHWVQAGATDMLPAFDS